MWGLLRWLLRFFYHYSSTCTFEVVFETHTLAEICRYFYGYLTNNEHYYFYRKLSLKFPWKLTIVLFTTNNHFTAISINFSNSEYSALSLWCNLFLIVICKVLGLTLTSRYPYFLIQFSIYTKLSNSAIITL